MRDEEGHVWIGVHFGSRGLGHSTATKYLKLAGGKDGMNVPPAILEAKSDLGRAYLAGMELGGLYAYVGREWVVERVGLRTPGTVFLVGGPANDARAEKFISATSSRQIVNACDLRLIEAAALVRLADLFVGPSSGPLNLAAAGGTDAFGPVRLDAGFDLFEIHPRHRAGGRSLPRRHGADCTGAGAGAARALSNAAETVGIDRAMSAALPY